MKNWEKNIRRVVPYIPGEQPAVENVIKLNTNENPYPPAPGVQKMLESMDGEKFRLYPDPACSVLNEEIARAYGVKKDQVFTGVGSDDVLAMCFMTFFNGSRPILFPDITYSFYDVWADMLGIPYKKLPLDDEFCIRPEDYRKENGGIIFPNPNAPTGVELPQEAIRDILDHNPDSIVIVDEAYVDFGARSALELLDTYDNLIIVQTFSKSRSMAGMRIGFAISSSELIRYLNDVKYSFNSYTMSQAALMLGAEAVKDREYFHNTLSKIIATRERVKDELKKLGFTFPDSKSNFIFATHSTCQAKDLFEAMKREKIYVRYFEKPRIDNYLRITIGTDAQMDALLDFLKRYLKR